MWRRTFHLGSKIYAAAVCTGGASLAATLVVPKQEDNRIDGLSAPEKARHIVGPLDKTGLKARLYQYQTCPFCCKVRAFLDYYGFDYEIIEVNPLSRKEIKFAPGQKKVPVVTCSCLNQPLIESSLIISIFSTFLQRNDLSLDEVISLYPPLLQVEARTGKEVKSYPNKYFIMLEKEPLFNSDIQNAREEREWREWVDNHFIHVISPSIYRTMNESIETFKWFSKAGNWDDIFSTIEKQSAIYVGAVAMYFVSRGLKKKHNINDARKEMEDSLNKWMAAIGPSRTFMGGREPNLADIALYGAIQSFVGLDCFEEMKRKTNIEKWFNAMDKLVKERHGSKYLKNRC
uniref:Prostaglandin E synthase 2 n=1 Tax=Parastrongyloides trichosuri TaxID=131310 RepID=A0A0N4Z675_PARTI